MFQDCVHKKTTDPSYDADACFLLYCMQDPNRTETEYNNKERKKEKVLIWDYRWINLSDPDDPSLIES